MSKSVLVPCTKLVFLGVVLCFEIMTVRLTQENMDDFKLAGELTAAEPDVQHAPLFIRPLEKVKKKSTAETLTVL